MKRIFMAVAAFLVLTGALGQPCARADETFTVGADGAALIEKDTRSVLFARAAHTRLPMASTTKIMTALLVIENCGLNDTVTIPLEAAGTEGSSMYLAAGEELTVRDLLHGLMLVSGNDAAAALAVHVSGSIDAFAALMTARAREIGALNTNFITPNGLHHNEHYTTAYDLALIAAEAMDREEFREIASCQYYRTESGSVARTLKNKNRMLWEYGGCTGIKTGYTKAAGKCLVFSAERDSLHVIGVVLNCPDMFPTAEAMLDYAFENYTMAAAVSKGDVIARVNVFNSQDGPLELIAKDDIMIPVERKASIELSTRVDIRRGISAPVAAGETLGTVEVKLSGRAVASCELVAADEVRCARYGYFFKRLAAFWSG